MENLENIQSPNIHIFTPEEVLKNQTKDLIHTLMDAGKASKKQAWAMSEILDEVSMRFGRDMTAYAKKYILQLCTN
jgi:hypothetical protein